jgi:hypothetical protein
LSNCRLTWLAGSFSAPQRYLIHKRSLMICCCSTCLCRTQPVIMLIPCQADFVIPRSFWFVRLNYYHYPRVSPSSQVESDYTVVFFAAGGRYAPSWNWVWKAYRSLSRKYRKNLKRLVIIHQVGRSFYLCSAVLFSLAGAVVRSFSFAVMVSNCAEHCCA